MKKKFKDSLVGRVFIFPILPLDFEEFLTFKEWNGSIKKEIPDSLLDQLRRLFIEYLSFGAYPEVALFKSEQKKINYLKHIISLYIRKDIRDIGNVRNVTKFNDLLVYLADLSGELMKIENISNDLRIAKETVND